jgi:hypothetical protein
MRGMSEAFHDAQADAELTNFHSEMSSCHHESGPQKLVQFGFLHLVDLLLLALDVSIQLAEVADGPFI